ncbi:hypothetical protein CBW65_10450 [Tumebacillus avium]|uniref:Uncharacterized protein n=1 Tax=Tumebacillus avium TaxID=1903704 RepID=A0A1Y0IPS9_9BACL|nr:hypothetical protein [Tumebacillus avium]ARU61373.1 hypothetical protein CBW65_10450 [Tumebacillus avium]
MKKMIWCASVVLCIIALYLLNRDPLPDRVTTGFGIPEYEHYKKVEQLEQDADLIVSARFTGKRETVDLSVDWEGWGEGQPYYVSRSAVKITNVFKGTVQKGNRIFVNEEGYLEDDTYHGSIGYKWMTKKGEYLLFLDKSQQQGDVYYIVGNYQGKFDYTTPAEPPEKPRSNLAAYKEHRYEYFGEHMDEFYNLKQQAITKYPHESYHQRRPLP